MTYMNTVCVLVIGLLQGQLLQPSFGVAGTSIGGDAWVDFGEDATFTCTESNPYSFVQWRMSTTNVTDVLNSQLIVTFVGGSIQYDPSIDQTRYVFDDPLVTNRLMVKSVTLNDEKKYWCRIKLSSGPYVVDTFHSRIRVAPSAVTLIHNSVSYSNADTFPVVAGDGHLFTCSTPAIKPAATFTWTLTSGSTIDNPSGTQTDSANSGDSRLVDSTNTITISIPEIPSTSTLTCGATNRQDGMNDTEINITVTLHVRVPPKEVRLSDSSGDKVPGATVSVNQSTSHKLTCKVQGTRPAATIAWRVAGMPPSTGVGDSTSMLNNDLWDTSGTWSFNPARSHHRQEVKCTANTSESVQPFPSAMITLDVNGPPDTPVMNGSLTMTEGQPTNLTCTADMGYPDNWILVWSIGGPSIPGPTTAPSSSGDRFMFNSTFVYTPKREANGATINCGAEWDSWTSTSKGAFGPINVQYEPNITNKAADEVGAQHGEDAELLCIAVGNPRPTIRWLNPNNTEISNDMSKYTVKNKTTDGDSVFEYIVTGNLTIRNVSSQVDYGQYTCISTNGIGSADFLIINVTGPRQPDKPSGVRITDRTANSLTVRWTAGYDGGKDQWFHVGHLKSGDSSETMSDKITGNDYTVTGLEAYTDYEIRVYAQNEIGKNPNYAQTSTKTLPNRPVKDSGYDIEFNIDEGTVKIKGLGGKEGCIQIEVLYTDSSEWSKCGECITADDTVVLKKHCPKPQQTRRKRAVGDVTDVRILNCQGDLCSEPVVAKKVFNPSPTSSPASNNTPVIVGGVVGCLALVAVIGGLVFYLRKTSPSKQKDVSCSSIELQGPDLNSDTGVSNEGLQGSGTGNTAIYAQVNKKGNQPKSFKAAGNANVTDSYLEMNNKPPARPEKPRNLPDVTYAVVDKEKKQPPPPPTQGGSKPPANKKKPKKYVPPSSRAEEESAYEDVMIDGKKATNPPPKEADDTYANFGEQQDNGSGRVISEDGLIYAEVGHTKVHPPNQPPIRTEESTEYASLDFSRMKTNNST